MVFRLQTTASEGTRTKEEGQMFHLIGFIITGLIVGLIARAIVPGRDNMGWGLTALLGVIGALVAGWLGRAVGWYGPDDGAGFLASTVGAIIVLLVYHAVSHNRATPIPR
jgi:uncharacterized membrane protein YeaQ/YmgE (transglycosylase-associated protein family)